MNEHEQDLPQRGQGGYALIVVLVAVGVFSLIVMALLDLVTTDTTSNLAYGTAQQRVRVTNGALQVGVDKLKVTPAAQLGNGACAGLPDTPLDIEGRTVTMDCIVPSQVPPVAMASAGSGGTVLTTTGNYDVGAIDDAGKWLTNLVTLFGGNPKDGPGFAHIADAPLKVLGDVKVRQWGLGMTPKATGSSVNITGSYREGDSQRAACGGGDAIGNAWTPPKALTFSTTGTRECAVGRDNVVAAAGPSVTAPTLPAGGVTLPACANGTVVQMPVGAYTAAQVAILNVWFKAGACDDVTFWFPPGNYSFEASGSDGAAAALLFDDASSNWVFGTPVGWTPPARATAANFPEACDRSKPGVAITLGASTSLRQNNGQVAMCGLSATSAIPTIYQLPTGSLPDAGWAGEPATVTSLDLPTFVTAPGAVGASVAIGVPADYPALGKRYDTVEGTTEAQRAVSRVACQSQCAPSWVLTGLGDGTGSAPTRPLSTAVLKVRGSSTTTRSTPFNPFDNRLGDNSKTIVSIKRADNVSCQAIAYDWPRNMNNPISVNLLSTNMGVSSCSPNVIRTAKDLEDATITVYIAVHGDCSTFLCVPALTLSVDYMWIETHTGTTTTPDPIPMTTMIDPVRGKSINVFGNVHVPRTQIDVKWAGDAAVPVPRELPVFVGSVVTRGLASSTLSTNNHVGVLASRALVPASRHVIVRVIDAGKLIGTAEVIINDSNTTGTAIDPGRELGVVSWDYCQIPVTPTATC